MKKLGDRKDAKRIREIDGLSQLSIDLKPHRSVSDVYINQKIDMTKLCKYIEKVKKEDNEITYFHAFVTAIGKAIYNRPKMNRFVANRHIYEHNDVSVSFVAKVAFDDKAEEVMIIVKIDKNDNIKSISKKIKEQVNNIRKNKEIKKQGANNAIDVLGHLPNIIRVPIVSIFKCFDRLGILPKSLIKDNLYYSSIIVSNLGSIHCDAIFHNINDFGTCSSLATIGEIKDEYTLNKDGKIEERKICEWGVNLDERIADGYYFVKTIKLIQYIFNNPELLEDDANARINIEEL